MEDYVSVTFKSKSYTLNLFVFVSQVSSYQGSSTTKGPTKSPPILVTHGGHSRDPLYRVNRSPDIPGCRSIQVMFNSQKVDPVQLNGGT